MKPKLIRASVCHDVRMGEYSDMPCPLRGGWHKGWKLPGSDAVAFYYGKKWWRSDGQRLTWHKTKAKALGVETQP